MNRPARVARGRAARRWLPACAFLLLPSVLMDSVLAQQGREPIEEIIVTGSYIRGTPENAELPVDVLTSADLEAEGSPSLAEMVRNLSYTSGNLAETNQFQPGGQANAGVTTINLRGLGAARTLVLINGHRQVPTQAVGVDLSTVPMIAVGRFETLKDGAAALYGSDAIGGVVNIITRKGFEGLELKGSNQFIDESDGEWQVGGLYGWANETVNFIVAAEYDERDELKFRDRDWGLLPFEENPQGGWSAIGNPVTIFRTGPIPVGPLAAGQPSAECEALGGAVANGFCNFQYTYFDNLIEKTEAAKGYAELNVMLGGAHEWHTELMYGEVELPSWKTSPAYPPQSLFGPDRFVAPTHPGLIAYKAANPELFPDIVIPGVITVPTAAQGAYPWGRYLGVNGFFGEPQDGLRKTESMRAGTSLTGSLFEDQLDYEIAVTYSERERTITFADMFVERMAFALDGLGGPGCDPATGTPGVGPCEYFNPFANAIEFSVTTGEPNPSFDPSVANSDEMIEWLVARGRSETTNKLLVWDAVFSGQTALELPGGAVGWAAGFQARREKFDFRISDNYNLSINPCPFADPFSITLGHTTTLDCPAPTGSFAFLSGSIPEQTSRTVYGLFTELALPVTDTLDLQLAARFEDYGGGVGSTLDPKIAFRWQANDWLALRGSASTTFRGPPQSFLSGRGTALVFITDALAFKAVDTLGNPDLDPESAVTTNLGVLLELENVYASLDWWRFDFSDPFQTESPNQILGAYNAAGCADGGAGAGTPTCAALRSHVFPLGTPGSGVERIEVNVINGADQQTSGFDLYAQYEFDLGGGLATIGTQGTYVLEYESDDFVDINGVVLAPGGDFVGKLNDGDPFTPMPELQADLFATWSVGRHNLRYVMRYVDSYEDVRPSIPELGTIDDHITHDFHYILRLLEDDLILSLSAVNFTDEDPPIASTDLNYDPFTHNAFGRMVKLGLKYTLGGR